MNRYTLVNENRANEFIEELEGVLNDKIQELDNIENQIKEDFCGKIPKDLKHSLSEWSQIHKNEKWIEIKKEKDRKFNKFNSLCHGYISLRIGIKKFANNINLITETQPKEPNEAINDYLGDDKLSFNEALFCLLGLDPGVLLKIDIASLSALKVREEEDKFLLGNLSLTKEFRKLDKAPIFNGTNNNRTVMTNKFTQWLTNKSIIEEAEPYNEENKMQPNDIDKLTGIPYARLIIYKKTLPEYLLKLKEPTSIRKLTIDTNEIKTNDYALSIQQWVGGIGGSQIRKDLMAFIKSDWWKSQPKEIQEKIQKAK